MAWVRAAPVLVAKVGRFASLHREFPAMATRTTNSAIVGTLLAVSASACPSRLNPPVADVSARNVAEPARSKEVTPVGQFSQLVDPQRAARVPVVVRARLLAPAAGDKYTW